MNRGRLVLVPNTLDFGVPGNAGEPPGSIADLLPGGVLQRVVTLRHWLVEDAKTARAFIKRAAQAVGAPVVLAELDIQPMPRPPKGGADRGGRTLAPQEVARCLAPLEAGHDLGLLSEAGLPGVADPGRDWVAAAHAAGHAVQVLPGASSITLAVAASGLGGQSFAFVGYLPQAADERRARVQALEQASRRLGQTQVAIETPYRNAALWAALVEHLSPSTALSVSVALATPQAWTRTARVERWRREPLALDDRLPAVFSWMAG